MRLQRTQVDSFMKILTSLSVAAATFFACASVMLGESHRGFLLLTLAFVFISLLLAPRGGFTERKVTKTGRILSTASALFAMVLAGFCLLTDASGLTWCLLIAGLTFFGVFVSLFLKEQTR